MLVTTRPPFDIPEITEVQMYTPTHTVHFLGKSSAILTVELPRYTITTVSDDVDVTEEKLKQACIAFSESERLNLEQKIDQFLQEFTAPFYQGKTLWASRFGLAPTPVPKDQIPKLTYYTFDIYREEWMVEELNLPFIQSPKRLEATFRVRLSGHEIVKFPSVPKPSLIKATAEDEDWGFED